MKKVILCLIVAGAIFSGGCQTINRAKEAERLEGQLTSLRNEIDRLNAQKESRVSELENAKLALENALQQEIGQYKAKLAMTERGLVITFLAEVFFDSGKDQLKPEGKDSLKKVSVILNKGQVIGNSVAIEGHTDNDPIKHSGWKSNWELSTARSLAVVHFLIDELEFAPERLSACGFAEFHPVASNDTVQSRQQNRRVEIVIMPAQLKRQK